MQNNNKKGRIPAKDTTESLLPSNYSRLCPEDQAKVRKLAFKLKVHRLRVFHADPRVRTIAEFILFILKEMEGNLHVK